VPTSCEQAVITALQDLCRRAPEYEDEGREAFFNAEQNALVAKNAELYYRTMVRGGSESWNVRDTHMADTLDRLMTHHGPGAKAIVWEHNTHIGDARATDMAREGMTNLGQLARERHGTQDVVLVGFGSHRGTVIAGAEWGAPMEVIQVPPARDRSWEAVLHEAGEEDKLLLLSGGEPLSDAFMESRGHRAIGVVYRPQFEAYGNYVPTVLPERYDAFLYIDQTRALRPLHLEPPVGHDIPDMYPTGV